jgi:hypothetical protein
MVNKMTDQIYYKIQYPLKKAINMIKAVDPDDPFIGEDENMVLKRGYEEIDNFLKSWEKEGRENLQDIIKRLRKTL